MEYILHIFIFILIYILLAQSLGLVAGYFLDRLLGTYILFAAILSFAGFGGGIFLVYRWVKTTVQHRLEEQKKEE